ncbi:MAG: hypothetical protein WC900_06135, partial [Oscillospiraceae bacterium]
MIDLKLIQLFLDEYLIKYNINETAINEKENTLIIDVLSADDETSVKELLQKSNYDILKVKFTINEVGKLTATSGNNPITGESNT